MLTTIAVIALCAISGGYLLGRSDLFLRRREGWVRGRDVLDAAMENDLDGFNNANPSEPFGMQPVDTRAVGDLSELADPSRRLRARWYWGWWWRAMVSCSVCAGWHVAWVVLAVWAVLAAATGDTPPSSWAEAPVVWGASCALHTLVSSAANRWDVW